MTREPIETTRQDRIYCLKASSDYHSELCEECRFYPNCDHITQDDMTELTIEDLEALEQEQDKPMVEIDLYSVIKQKYIERDVLDKIRAEIEKQEKWLLQAGYNTYNVDIAFNSIKLALAESEVKE